MVNVARLERPPVDVVEFGAKVKVILEFVVLHFFINVLKGVDDHNPAVFILDVFVPFFVIVVVATVVVEYVFTDQNVAVNAFFDHVIHQFTFEVDAVVVKAVVPFTDHFDDGVALIVIRVQHFQVQSQGANGVPLRMNEIVVNFIGVIKLAILASVEGRVDVFSSHVVIPPAVVWFDVLHGRNFFLEMYDQNG